MKGYILAVLLLGALLQNVGSLVAQTKKPARCRATKSAKPKKLAAASVRKKKSAPKYKPAPPVDPTEGDNVDGDDLEIRRAAVDALGTMNGSVVVVDPTSGRILTMVNQKLAFKSGFTPCSTIKLVTSLAALSENVVDRDTVVPIGRYVRFNMTTALAKSNNEYFSVLGNRLGFERVTKYAHMLGLGELAGLDIPGEQPGTVPAEPPKWGGVGMMTSFGEGFLQTPLELASLLSAIANGGTHVLPAISADSGRDREFPAQGEAHAGTRAQRHHGRQARDARRGRLRHGAAGELRSERADSRQDRDLHGFPRVEPHGLVRVVQRGRIITNWWSSSC